MRPSFRLIVLLFIAAVLAYKTLFAGHTPHGFTDAIEAAYGSESNQGFFTTDVKFMLALAAFILLSYLPFGQVAEEMDDIWTAERRRRYPQTH